MEYGHSDHHTHLWNQLILYYTSHAILSNISFSSDTHSNIPLLIEFISFPYLQTFAVLLINPITDTSQSSCQSQIHFSSHSSFLLPIPFFFPTPPHLLSPNFFFYLNVLLYRSSKQTESSVKAFRSLFVLLKILSS